MMRLSAVTAAVMWLTVVGLGLPGCAEAEPELSDGPVMPESSDSSDTSTDDTNGGDDAEDDVAQALGTLRVVGTRADPGGEAQDAAPDEATDAGLPASLPTADADQIESIVAQSAAAGRVTVIDFWATWCIPCVAMFPGLHEGLTAMGEDVRPVSVTLDAPGESEAAAIAFLDKHHALKDAYLLVPDSDAQIAVASRIGENWNSLVVPAIFVYDQQGRLAGEFFDSDADVSAILQRVRELVAQ